MKKRVAMAIFAVVSMQRASAHHGFAVHYDIADQVRIEGRVHEAILKNPHSVLRILVSDASGGDDFLASGNLVAGNPKIHTAVLKAVNS